MDITDFIKDKTQYTNNNDDYDYNMIKRHLDSFIKYVSNCIDDNKKLKNKKIRLPNFPSEISENIVKFSIYKHYGIFPRWDIKCGDLQLDNIKIEVKAFSSNGPTSFGPKENWDLLYFINCKDYINYKFKIYEIKLSNNDPIFQSLKMNKKETYQDQCKQKRRPRISFELLIKQLPTDKYKIIFDGTLSELSS